MAFGSQTINSFAGAASDIFGGEMTAEGLRLKASGDLAEATNYDMAAKLARENEDYTKTSTAIKEAQAQREAYLGIGQTTADIAGSGFSTGKGSALDILRSGASQAALTRGVLSQQGLITEAGYDEQARSYVNMAAAARYAASVENKEAGQSSLFGDITGGLKAAAGIASLL